MLAHIYFEYKAWSKKNIPLLKQCELTKEYKVIKLADIEKDLTALYVQPKVITVTIEEVIYIRDDLIKKEIRIT